MKFTRACLLIVVLAAGAPAGAAGPGPLADIGPAPAVALADSSGKPFELASLRGKAVLVSFVFTTCTGTCPATTNNLVAVRDALDRAGLWGTRVEFVSITLDPRRDTPAVLRDYAQIYKIDTASWHFLTGPPDRVLSVIHAWDMWVRTTPAGALDHPSRIFLVDPRGRRREIYNLDFLRPATVLQDVRSVLAEEGEKTNPSTDDTD